MLELLICMSGILCGLLTDLLKYSLQMQRKELLLLIRKPIVMFLPDFLRDLFHALIQIGVGVRLFDIRRFNFFRVFFSEYSVSEEAKMDK